MSTLPKEQRGRHSTVTAPTLKGRKQVRKKNQSLDIAHLVSNRKYTNLPLSLPNLQGQCHPSQGSINSFPLLYDKHQLSLMVSLPAPEPQQASLRSPHLPFPLATGPLCVLLSHIPLVSLGLEKGHPLLQSTQQISLAKVPLPWLVQHGLTGRACTPGLASFSSEQVTQHTALQFPSRYQRITEAVVKTE